MSRDYYQVMDTLEVGAKIGLITNGDYDENFIAEVTKLNKQRVTVKYTMKNGMTPELQFNRNDGIEWGRGGGWHYDRLSSVERAEELNASTEEKRRYRHAYNRLASLVSGKQRHGLDVEKMEEAFVLLGGGD